MEGGSCSLHNSDSDHELVLSKSEHRDKSISIDDVDDDSPKKRLLETKDDGTVVTTFADPKQDIDTRDNLSAADGSEFGLELPESITKLLQEKFSKNQVLIDGPELTMDHSYYLIDQCEELKQVEHGIPVSRYLSLNLNEKPIQEDFLQYEGISYSELPIRDLEMEYRILMRINCHKGQFNNLYKNSSSEFRRKNKYNEILPYLHNQVKLKYSFDTPDDKFQDYYNASFVNIQSSLVGSRGSKTFIAAMAPTINTVDSLWKLIVEQRISLIIQLCPDEENGKEMCFRYYRSQSEHQSNFTFGGYQMIVKQRIEVRSGLFMTDIQVIEQNGEIVHTVRHLQETLWPDNKPPGVREDCGPSEAFQRLIYTLEVIERNRTVDPSSPVLVHLNNENFRISLNQLFDCSAGVGRTGTLISLYTVYEAIKYQRESLRLADPMISIFGVVRRLREQRWNSVRNIF